MRRRESSKMRLRHSMECRRKPLSRLLHVVLLLGLPLAVALLGLCSTSSFLPLAHAQSSQPDIDPDTPSGVRTVTVKGTQYQLVWSDEFEKDGRKFGGLDHSEKWYAEDSYYVSTGDYEVYKPEAVTTSKGKAMITFQKQVTFDRNGTGHEFVSGMMNTWNRFCFTGGYMEIIATLPGDGKTSGYWPAVWALGNLGRPGLRSSTDGLWPYTYDTCDAAVNKLPWDSLPGQKINKCLANPGDGLNPNQGRGVPEWDMFEAFANGPHLGQAGLSLSMQVAPKLPPGLSYDKGITYNNGTPFMSQANNFKGSRFQDTISAEVPLTVTDWLSPHKYGVEWIPGDRMRWFIDGVMVMEATSEALGPQGNELGAVGQRLIPVEPMYLIMNLAAAENFSPLSPNLPLPGIMTADYVRVYQKPGAINTGCSPAAFPTAQYIKDNPDIYETPVCGNAVCEVGECASCQQDCSPTACNVPQPDDCLVYGLRNPSLGLDNYCKGTWNNGWNFKHDDAAKASLYCVPGLGALMQITDGGPYQNSTVLYQVGVRLQKGVGYNISVTASATINTTYPNNGAAPYVEVQVDSGFPDYNVIGPFFRASKLLIPAMQTYYFAFTSDDDYPGTARLALLFGGPVSDRVAIVVQSVTLSCLPPPEPVANRPILYNSNLGIGDGKGCYGGWSDPWTFSSTPDTTVNCTCNPDDQGNNRKMLIRFVDGGGSDPYTAQLWQSGIYLKGGQKYTLIVQGRAQYDIRTITFSMDQGMPPYYSVGGLTAQTFNMDNYFSNWKYSFTPTADVTGSSRMVLAFGGYGGGPETFTIQSIQIVEGNLGFRRRPAVASALAAAALAALALVFQ